jgi:hypothetical protein
MAVALYGMARGDHDIWYSPITNLPITVAVKIDSRYTANAIIRRVEIDFHF